MQCWAPDTCPLLEFPLTLTLEITKTSEVTLFNSLTVIDTFWRHLVEHI